MALSQTTENFLGGVERIGKKGTIISGISSLLTGALSRNTASVLFANFTVLFGTTRALGALGRNSIGGSGNKKS